MPMTTYDRLRAFKWTLVAVWMAVIFRLSALPGSAVPGRFGSVGHFGGYAVLGGLVLLALEKPSWWLRAVALASAYGITDELHQLFVPGRMCDPVDWVVDTTGAFVGALVVTLLLRARERGAGRTERGRIRP
ncbi:MAG: VanZ family protein [Actinomycetia bacterium]|nr:VanZ family protein [Actinomycetes bacterium]